MEHYSAFLLLFFSFSLLRHAFSQSLCDTLVENNAFTVDEQTAEDMNASQTTLQEVVDCLKDGATLQFATTGFTIDDTIVVDKDMTITSNREEKTSIDCNGRPVLDIRRAAVDISNVVIKECVLDAAEAPVVVGPDATVAFRSVKFLRNTNDDGPSAIIAAINASVAIEDSVFRHNSGSRGTAVLTDSRSLAVSGSSFSNNSATRPGAGGGVFLIQSESEPTTVILGEETKFVRNEAVDGDGGAVGVSGTGVSVVVEKDVLFKRNVAGRRGGAIFASSTSSLTVANAFFVENESKDLGGGAVFAEDDRRERMDVEITDTVFARNRATGYIGSGGAMRIQGQGLRCTLADSVLFTLNSAELDGGAMHVSELISANISGASFIGNEARNGGGAALFILSTQRQREAKTNVVVVDTNFFFNRGMYANRGGGCIGVAGAGTDVTFNRCSFKGNDGGDGAGGAIYVIGGSVVRISLSDFTANKAEWGGALYAENDVLFDINSTKFTNNSAEEGGALHIRGDVDVTMDNCTFQGNRALVEGGAVKVRNFVSSGDELARFRMTNSVIAENEAGTNLFEDRLYGTETQGGAILAEGSGIELELENNTFKRNLASNGGALSIYAVADCNIDNGNRFEDNNATFGAAVFFVVDEQVDPANGHAYRIARATFLKNHAEIEGGAIYVSSTKTDTNSMSLNAAHFRLLIEQSSFKKNSARRGGGAMSMIGSGVLILGSTFRSNEAATQSSVLATPFLSYGGAVNIQTGSSVECKDTRYLLNRANVGGAVFVRDGSFEGENIKFIGNMVVNGVGGAAAVEISKGRDIPLLNSPNHQNIIFYCDACDFEKNNGSSAGGALHVHDMDPGATFGEDNELMIEGCTYEGQNEFRTQDNKLTCPSYFRYVAMINARSIRLRNTRFTKNSARAGGAIFTNNLTMISIVPDFRKDLEKIWTLDYVLKKNETEHLNYCNMSFDRNRVIGRGYGERVASTPFEAFLVNLDGDDRIKRKGFRNDSFLSGERLRFDVEFIDGLSEPVTFAENLTAYISCHKASFERERSDCAQLEISGQETAQVDKDGKMKFTAVRLRGLKDQTYKLRIDYHSTSEMQTLHVNPSFIHVRMRPCKIGERTVSTESEYLECQECGQGEFQPFPDRPVCLPCVESENHTMCDGQTIVPHDGYWHASSFSFAAHQCIGHDACRSTGKEKQTREEKLRAIAVKKHKRGSVVLYNSDDDSLQCREGYQGVLCGRCVSGYGREGSICRKCASPALRAFLLAMLFLWSFVFLSCFIRSVLQLATRIKFNRRFNSAKSGKESPSEDLNAHIETIDMPTTSTPEISDLSANERQNKELSEIQEEPAPVRSVTVEPRSIHLERLKNLRPSPKKQIPKAVKAESQKRGIRNRRRLLKALHVLLDPNAPSEDVEPLTLANPVSEILKILVNFLQVTSVAVSINVDWEQSLRRTLFTMGAIGNLSSGTGYMSLDCYLRSSDTPKSLRRLTIAVLYPLLMLIVYVILWGCYTFIRRKDRQYFSQRILLTFLAINYFVYIGMTKNLLRFFACTHVSDDREDTDWSRYVWEEDTEVECYEGRHALLVGVLVVPLLLAVSIGYPALIFMILWHNKDRLNDEDFVQTYGFLYKAYDRHYWEVVIMMRKAAIATVAVFSYRLGSNLQGLLCVLVIGIALSIHLVLQPFTQDIPQLNHLETCSLSATFVVFVVGLMMNDNVVKHDGRVFLSVLAVLFLCFTILVLLTQLMFAAEEFIDMKLIELGAMEVQEVIDSRLFRKVEVLVQHYWRIALEATKTIKALTCKRLCCRDNSGNTTPKPVHSAHP